LLEYALASAAQLKFLGNSMERLAVGKDHAYEPVEASIHMGRYAPLLGVATDRKILDVACGEGYGVWALKQAGAAHVTGVDVSDEAIAAANRLFGSRDGGLAFHCGDWREILAKMPDGSFDLISSIETIEHLDDPEAFLMELRRVAAPDCIIYITCPNDHWYYPRPEDHNPYHKRKYTFEEFTALTTRVLGEASRWLAGAPVQGFASVPLPHRANEGPSRYVEFTHLGAAVLCAPGETAPDLTNCSYFVGLWNADALQGGAVFPISMDAYSARESAVGAREQLLLTLENARQDFAREREGFAREREGFARDRQTALQEIVTLRANWRAASTRANVLLSETAVLSASLNEARNEARALAANVVVVERDSGEDGWKGLMSHDDVGKIVQRFIRRKLIALKLKRILMLPIPSARRKYKAKITALRTLRKQIREALG